MSFPSLSDLAATTIENRSPQIADNITAQNALFHFINKAGNVKTYDGGTVIQENFSFAENGNGGSFSGYDLLPTAAADVISGAQYSMKQYAVPVVFSSEEEAINSGKSAIIDLVEARVTVAESTMKNLLNRHAYLDGTGNNGKNLTGLAAAVATTPTNTYGGINRSLAANAFWKNKAWTASSLISGAATSSTIQEAWNKAIIDVTRGADRPNVIICGKALYGIFESSLQANQRFTDASTASAGFQSLQFQGIPVVFDDSASGISDTVAYFLNTKYLKLRPHKDFNMTTLKDKQASNQAATVKTLVWYGNMTCSGAKFNGVFTNS
jgi:hypothetical protein